MVSTYVFLVEKKVGGRGQPFHPQLYYYSTGRGRKEKNKLSSLTNQLYYHYTCYILIVPIVTSPLPGMETVQLANLCV